MATNPPTSAQAQRPKRKKHEAGLDRFGIFLAEHLLPILGLIAFIALLGLGYAAYAGHEAATAQKATLNLTKQQGDQINQLKKLNTQATALAAQIKAQTAQRAKENAALLCGGFVPLSHINPSVASSEIGTEILSWAVNAKHSLKCPEKLTK